MLNDFLECRTFPAIDDEAAHIQRTWKKLMLRYGSAANGCAVVTRRKAALIAAVDAKHLRAAIAALPMPFRETLLLREVEGLAYREIAETTEVSIGTVMSRLARARRRLIAATREFMTASRSIATRSPVDAFSVRQG